MHVCYGRTPATGKSLTLSGSADHQPPLLVLWGRNDPIFSLAGAMAFQQDLRDVEFHLLDSGHFALEDCGYEIGQHVISFLERVVVREPLGAIESGVATRAMV